MTTSCAGLRLLLVGPYPPPFGGVASHLTTLIPGLKARGAEDIAVVSFADVSEVTTIDGATVYRINAKEMAVGLASLSALSGPVAAAMTELGGAGLGMRQLVAEATRAKVIDEIARKHQSNVASFYQANLSLALLPVAKLLGPRCGFVLTVFGEVYDDPVFFADHLSLASSLINLPHSVAASSKHCARSFGALGISREIEPVYYGVDLERFEASDLREAYRVQVGAAPTDALVVFMGRFSREMGIDRLLDVVPGVLDRHAAVKFLLCGAKGEFADAAKAVADRYPERVRVQHNVPFAEQPAIYAASDIVVTPTADQHACMGMTIKEAMAASRAVIGSIAGGIPEAVVDGETGLLVPLDDSKSIDAAGLSDAIIALTNDLDTRSRMGAAGRRRAEAMFAHDRTNERMAQLFMAARPIG
jgi:glycosyltransferase involved in cell wall biosynthesis